MDSLSKCPGWFKRLRILESVIMNFRIRYNNFEKKIFITNFRIWFFLILIWKECRFLNVPEKNFRALSRCVSINLCKSIAQIEIYSQCTKNPFSQNFKISCNDFESEKMFFLSMQFVITIEFLITNSIT